MSRRAWIALEDEAKQEFEELCTPWYSELLGFANHLTKDADLAQDLLQDTWIRAMRAWHRFEALSDPSLCARGWLFQILMNTFINLYHKRRKERERIQNKAQDILVKTYGTTTDAHDPREELVDHKFSDDVQAALGRLSEKQREMIMRCDAHGEGYREIADAMGIPIGTVMSGLSRARKRLALELAGFAKDAYRLAPVKPAPTPAPVSEPVRRRTKRTTLDTTAPVDVEPVYADVSDPDTSDESAAYAI